MKKWIIGFWVLAACCVMGDDAAFSARFEWSQSLETQPEKGQRGRICLTGEVFDQARHFPSDIRLLDEEGLQWPFFLMTPVDRTVSEQRTPQLLNKAWVDGPTPHWTFDLIVSDDDRAFVHNGLEVQTSGSEFVRRVEISRDASEGRSAHVASGYLIRFPNNRSAKNRRVVYPDSDASRLHVRVYSNARNADESFEVQAVLVSSVKTIAAERQPVAAESCLVSEKETEERTQTFLLDTGFKNRPVEFITFDVADASFVRSVSVRGRNEQNEPWHWVGGGEIHRLDTDEETSILLRATTRWLKIGIHQNDNQPLDIEAITLEAAPRNLVFEAASDRPARLCFRGWEIPSASYDLKRRISTETSQNLPLYATKPMIPNAHGADPSFFRKYSSALSAVAVGMVGLLTVWIIIRMMRHPPVEG